MLIEEKTSYLFIFQKARSNWFVSNFLEQEGNTSGNGSTEDTSTHSVSGSGSTSRNRGGTVGTVSTVGGVGGVVSSRSDGRDGSERGNNVLELHF